MKKRKTLADYPKLLSEWHPTKNGSVNPLTVNIWEKRTKYWWRCEKGHAWEARCENRICGGNRGIGTGCIYCCNWKSSPEKSFGVQFPDMINEWCYDKNAPLTPFDVAPYSDKKCWWKCQKDHEYQMSCYNKGHGHKCGYCQSKKASKEHNLAVVYPDLAKQWDYEKNAVSLYEVLPSSGKKYWFKCSKGHGYESRPYSKSGCPYCVGQKVCLDNCLATVCPEIAALWDYEKNINVTPLDVMPSSHKKYWFKCLNGHSYIAALNNIRHGGTGCNICKKSHGEKRIESELKNLKLKFTPQAKFKTCKAKKPLPFDFLVAIDKDTGFLIEFQGDHHYRSVKRGNKMSDEYAEKEFERVKKYDEIKFNWCKKRNISLLIIPYWERNNIRSILKNFICEKFKVPC